MLFSFRLNSFRSKKKFNLQTNVNPKTNVTIFQPERQILKEKLKKKKYESLLLLCLYTQFSVCGENRLKHFRGVTTGSDVPAVY